MKTPQKEQKKKITARTYDFLVEKLKEMKTIGRKILADKLDHYRNDENFEENSAISEVLEEKESLEKEIVELEDTLEKSEVVKNGNKCKTVDIGCKVELESKGKKKTINLVSSISSDPESGKVSAESPLGKAIVGKGVGQIAVVDTPQGKNKFKVVKID
jgi:transcription elongation factor GreA